MTNKLYYIAYKFLKNTNNNPFSVTEKLNKTEKEKVFKFLSYNHQIKFI